MTENDTNYIFFSLKVSCVPNYSELCTMNGTTYARTEKHLKVLSVRTRLVSGWPVTSQRTYTAFGLCHQLPSQQ